MAQQAIKESEQESDEESSGDKTDLAKKYETKLSKSSTTVMAERRKEAVEKAKASPLEKSSNSALQRLATANKNRRLSKTFDAPPVLTDIEKIEEETKAEPKKEESKKDEEEPTQEPMSIDKKVDTIKIVVQIPSLEKEFSHDLHIDKDEAAYNKLVDAVSREASASSGKLQLRLGELELKPRHLNYLQEGDTVEVNILS